MRKALFTFGLVTALTAPHAAWAAPGDAASAVADEPEASGDIVVTARRTNERLQDVPVAVTALTGEAIANRNLTTVAEIQAVTPSLNFTSTNGQAGKSAVSLRGQRQSGSGIGVDPSVGVYINELYMARATIDTALYDLESVQILKGPQGTLFGRNTTGGAVLVGTKRPGDYLGGYAKAQLETPWGYTLEGALNVPLGEGNALRVAGIRQFREGYSTVANRGYKSDDRKRWGLRGTLQMGSGDLKTTFIGDYYTWHENGMANYPLSYASPPANAAAFTAAIAAQAAANSTQRRQFYSSGPTFSRGHTYSALNTTTYQLTDDILFKNIIGFAASFDDNSIEYDGTPALILSTGVTADQRQFSEEAQVQGKSFDGALEWIVGGYYFRESGYDRGGAFAFTDPNLPHTGTRNKFEARNTALSVFAHASYLLPVGVPAHIFGGIRRGRDTRRISFQTGRDNTVAQGGGFTCLVAGAPGTPVANGGQGIPGGDCRLDAQKNFPSTTWDVGIDVKPVRDLLVYGSVSRGYRTGGFNGRATNATSQIPFNPESVLNYELGFKFSGDLGNMRTTLNVAAYHSDYSSIQLNNIVNLFSTITNAGKGRVRGIEVEASIRPIDGLTLSGFYSLTDARYRSFLYGPTTYGPGNSQGPAVLDLASNHFAGVPRNQAGAAIDWDVLEAPGVGKLHLNANVKYNGSFYLDPVFQAPYFPNYKPEAINAAYTVFNAGIRLEEAFGSPATVDLYVKNIGNKVYGSGGFASYGSGFASQTLGDPRVFGIGVRLPFGGE